MFSAKDLFFTPPAGGYTIAKSLRFRSSASAYLSRTPGSASNQTTWTWSGWVKRGTLGAAQVLFSAGSNTSNTSDIFFTSADLFSVSNYVGAAFKTNKISNAVFRDPSAWYHVVVASNGATSLNAWVNNQAITWGTSTGPDASNWFFNSTNAHSIGRYQAGATQYFDGYLTEVNFIDGQALDPTYFGQTDTATGVWMPKAYTGSYGTNGFYLKFADASAATAAAIGKDSSPNGNNWTPTNISVTAGVTYDSMVDTPTSYDNGGTGAGNYATFNVNNQIVVAGSGGSVVSQANLLSTGPASASSGSFYPSTIAASAGKWYAELTVITAGTANSNFGIVPSSLSRTWSSSISVLLAIYNSTSSSISKNGSTIQSGLAAWANGDVCGIAIDLDAGTVQYYRNGSAYGSQVTSITTVEYCIGLYTSQDSLGSVSSAAINFGQRPFTYTPPTGFKALCTQNLPTPTIGATSSTLANKYMDIALYNGTSASNSITSLNFKPDLVWIKSRSAATAHELTDAVRGTTKSLSSNSTAAEATDTNGLTAFLSNGFSVGSDSNYNNGTGPATYVAWNWLGANGTASNTNGTITSTVSANVTAGFSVVTYTGTGANATVGHGLGVAPKMVIAKNRDVGAYNWNVYTTTTGFGNVLQLNTTAAQTAAADAWNSASPTFNSTVFSVGTNVGTNQSGTKYVAYCFAEVAGYSKFGSYTGNGSADGPFVYCGFRPRYIMLKCSGAVENWQIYDTARDTYNVAGLQLLPNSSAAEASAVVLDILSNGFKLRNSTAGGNQAQAYIYAAFAESPFNYSRAR